MSESLLSGGRGSLSRRYRPSNFAEVTGQEHVRQALRHAVERGNVGHAYLFCGARGIGKTTLARILAKAVNCTATVQGDACGTCESCVAIATGKTLDIVEVDAASNRGIDEIRQLQERVAHPPSVLLRKVFIVDEVHMLTIDAFNALLKTLEEPPAHVLFVLATTEIHKVPATIQSRCQRFDLKKIGFEPMMARLRELVAGEGAVVDDAALELVCSQAEGCLRDAESLLTQVLAFGGDEITREVAAEVLRVGDLTKVAEFLKAVGEAEGGDGGPVFEMCAGLIDDGIDLKVFALQLVAYVRRVILGGVSDTMKSRSVRDLSESDQKMFDEVVDVIDVGLGMRVIRSFSGAVEDMDLLGEEPAFELAVFEVLGVQESTPSPRMVDGGAGRRDGDVRGEVAFQALESSEPVQSEGVEEESNVAPVAIDDVDLRDILQSVAAQEDGEMEAERAAADASDELKREVVSSKADLRSASDDISVELIEKSWGKIVSVAIALNHSVGTFLKMSRPVDASAGVVVVACKFAFHQKKLTDAKHRTVVGAAFDQVIGTGLKIDVIVKEDLVVHDVALENVSSVEKGSADEAGLEDVMEVFGDVEAAGA